MVTDNSVLNEPSYFNLSECGKYLLNILDATCERVCMVTSRERYYMEILKTPIDYNECNNTQSSNSNILEATHKVMEEEYIAGTNNVSADTFSHTSNKKKENAKAIFTSENIDKSDDLVDAKKLKSTTPNIMNQTQRPHVMHKAILHAIRKQFLTPVTVILNKTIE